ncbi:MAG: hypothetical protein C5B52_14625 [Bacteroidetes bacterium]|nr:MAG: hypothetical protein C5B52_14625 [Bacteroidota bacterium]
MRNIIKFAFSVTILIFGNNIFGQSRSIDIFSLVQSGKMKGFNRTVTTFTEGNRKGISFDAKEGDGIAWIEGMDFTNGTIELDIKGRDILQQSFVGIAFHGQNNLTFESVYFRPFNFRSTDPLRKIHAVQYTFNPDFGWEKLRTDHPGVYEKGIDDPPLATEWFHAKIVVNYPEIKVYVNDSQTPSLEIQELNSNKSGKIGIWVGNNSDGQFANLVITPK